MLYAAGMHSILSLLTVLALDTAVAPVPRFNIALAMDARLPPAIGRLSVAEAAAVWAPYGVTIVQQDPAAPCGGWAEASIDAGLTVRLAEPAPVARGASVPFGSIRFLPDGEPEPTIQSSAFFMTPLTPCAYSGLAMSNASADRICLRRSATGDGLLASMSGLNKGRSPRPR